MKNAEEVSHIINPYYPLIFHPDEEIGGGQREGRKENASESERERE